MYTILSSPYSVRQALMMSSSGTELAFLACFLPDLTCNVISQQYIHVQAFLYSRLHHVHTTNKSTLTHGLHVLQLSITD